MKVNDSITRGLIEKLISESKYLESAELIKKSINSNDYSDSLRTAISAPNFLPSDIHKHILNIDQKVVITTNFDSIYENFCLRGDASSAYRVVKYYDGNIVDSLRSPVRTIIKAHGCITDPSNLIFSKSEFFEAKQKYFNFYKIMDALFLTNTIVFIGYSLQDPDIQLILENVNITAASSHKHYFITSANLHPVLKAAAEKTYNLHFLEYPAGQHETLNNSLKDLVDKVQNYRTTNPAI